MCWKASHSNPCSPLARYFRPQGEKEVRRSLLGQAELHLTGARCAPAVRPRREKERISGGARDSRSARAPGIHGSFL